MSRARKVDVNQAEIVEALRSIPGCVVWLTFRVGEGFPDILATFMGDIYLMEIKSGDGRLTKDEQQFFDAFTGDHLAIVRSVTDALKAIGVSTR